MARGRARYAIVAAVLLGGCGLGTDEARESGTATIAYSAQPASLDPALAYSVEAAALIWNVYLPPLTYRHADGRAGTEIVPALARSQPEVSRGGRRYTFRFRRGLRYSDGSALRARDFERAVKRTLYLASPGSKYFLDVRGARQYRRAREPEADLPGIETNDATGAVSVELEHPDGTFRYALASSFAAPVPQGTPFRRLARELPPATGAFRFARIEPGHEIVLERNDEMPRLAHVPRARLKRLTVRIVKDRRLQAERVSGGELDYMFDPLPVDMLAKIRREHRDRYVEFGTNSTLYFWLNSQVPPFDNPALRRAVHLGLDKRALARLYGGLLAPTCNFLPPGVPGYRRLDPCPFGRGADVDAARAIVEREGALGTPVNVWGHTLEPNRDATQAFADQLEAIGFKPRLKLVSASVYFQLVGQPRRVFQAGIGAWFQEYPHPASFFAAVRGDLIRGSGNYNYSRTDDPALTSAIKRLESRPRLTPRTLAGWAAIDRAVVEDAGVIPFGHSRYSLFMSDRMDFAKCAPRHLVYITDFSRFCTR